MSNINRLRNKIITGHCIDVLRKLPEDSIDMLLTSPPYWQARDYESAPVIWNAMKDCKHTYVDVDKDRNTDRSFRERLAEEQGKDIKSAKRKKKFKIKSKFCTKCGGWIGQLGQEPSPDMFVQNLVDIMVAAMRPLKPQATLWVNLGDSYGSSKTQDAKQPESYQSRPSQPGFEKSLLCIPFKFAMLMIQIGFKLRNVIIWHKPNAMPSSVKDRFTVDFEYLFMFSMKKKYYFEQQFDPLLDVNRVTTNAPNKFQDYGPATYSGFTYHAKDHPDGKNKRCVWSINTRGTKDKHFAIFPEELCITPIKAGCPKKTG
ncbi:MAG: site-specific DNA-methyltransferase, partial [Thermodesulfovibrionia bacterium]|nr:site-specific DNA-methyltransferase [Thermodesulfovibrionia bacterium]